LSVSSLSAVLALAALSSPPDVTEQIAERERFAKELTNVGLEPLKSYTNFLYVPYDEPEKFVASLLPFGVVVRAFKGAIRISVRDRDDDDVLLDAIKKMRVGELPDPSLYRSVSYTHLDVYKRQ